MFCEPLQGVSHIYDAKFRLVIDDFEAMSETRFRITDDSLDEGLSTTPIVCSTNIILHNLYPQAAITFYAYEHITEREGAEAAIETFRKYNNVSGEH